MIDYFAGGIYQTHQYVYCDVDGSGSSCGRGFGYGSGDGFGYCDSWGSSNGNFYLDGSSENGSGSDDNGSGSGSDDGSYSEDVFGDY